MPQIVDKVSAAPLAGCAGSNVRTAAFALISDQR